MEWIIEQLNTMGKAFVGLAIPMLPQSALLIGVVLLAENVLRARIRAGLRYWLVTCVLAYLVLTPLFSLNPPPTHWPAGKAAYAQGYPDAPHRTSEPEPTFTTPASHTTAPTDAPTPVGTRDPGSDESLLGAPQNAPLSHPTSTQSQTTSAGVGERPRTLSWQGAAFVLWLAGVIALGGVRVGRAAAACRSIDQSPAANHLMNDILVYCRKRMGVRGKVGLKVGYRGMRPAVCGLLRPVIIVPRNLAPTLGSRHLRDVLFHELAHVKRHDLWVNFAQNVLQVLYFYNPLLILVNRAIRRLREEAADETVLDTIGAGDEYTQRLADVQTITIQHTPQNLNLIGVA